MKKLDSYRLKGFSQVGLFMLYEEIPIPPGNINRNWFKWFEDSQEGHEDKYDFLYFCYPGALITYHFSSGCSQVDLIGMECYEELCKDERLAVELKC